MKDHLTRSKNDNSPACGFRSINKGATSRVIIKNPKLFNNSDYRCKKCEVIFFEKLEEAKRKLAK